MRLIIMNDEYWDLFDVNRVVQLRHHRRGDSIPDGLYHLVIHSWIMDSSGLFLMSQRQKGRSSAFKWERTGGSVLEGESSLDGAIREVYEELGIELNKGQAFFVKTVKRDHYHDMFDSWLFVVNKDKLDCKIDTQEVRDYKWMSLSDLDELKRKRRIVSSSLYYDEVFALFEQVTAMSRTGILSSKK